MDCDGTKDEKRCCRYPLTFNFEKLGWDWIIAPTKYEAHGCFGECPYGFLQKYPYTHIVSMEDKSPCCLPVKMSSISILHFDNHSNILLSTIPGMVVETCGCF
uniref:TGF-beta family profile domain-containing protein n=1 Tax=Timema poppense TaxID=170557 RepID=A0A7R9HA55_TIMPO|nr:unnamed protein product [Timema poppensis]